MPTATPNAAAPQADKKSPHTWGRDRTVTAGITTAIASKGFGLAAPLVITPICFRYLGNERYGLWMAVTALTSMAWFADLGLGNGLLTRLSNLATDIPQQRREISSAYATLWIVAATLLSALVVVNPVIPWSHIFAVTDSNVAAEAPAMALLCFGTFFVNIPLSAIQRVQCARGQFVQSNLWQSFGAFLSMVAVVGTIAVGCVPLVVIAGAVVAVPLSNLLNTIVYFWWQQPETRPAVRHVSRATAKSLLGLGLQFFLLTLMSSTAVNADNPMVAHILGVNIAAHFAVVGKMFGVLSLFVFLVSMTLWSVNGNALSQGDVIWVRRNTRRMVLLCGSLVGTAGLILVAFGKQIIGVWVGDIDTSAMSREVLSGLACWSFLVAITSPLITVQNSIGMLKPQFIGWTSFLVVATFLKIWGLHHLGLAGLPSAACIAYVTTIWPPIIIGYRRALRRCDNSESGGPARSDIDVMEGDNVR